MKPEVEAAIESRRQWFWVWTLGFTGGLGFAIVVQFIRSEGFSHTPSIIFFVLALAVLTLFITSLKLHRVHLAWTVAIAVISGLMLTAFFIAIDNILDG